MTHTLKLTLCVVAIVMTSAHVFAQSDSRNETGAQAGDLQLNSAVAPPARLDIPSVDDAISKHAPDTDNVEQFLEKNNTTPIPDLDPDRAGGVVADQRPSVPAAEATAEQSKAEQSTAEQSTAEQSTAEQSTAEHNVAKAIGNASADLSAIQRQLDQLKALVADQSTRLDAVEETQKSMMSADELRAEFAAIREAIAEQRRVTNYGSDEVQTQRPITGTLVVENLTGIGYTMNVNGVDIIVMPGRQAYPIEVGNVRTEIRGFEAPRAWSADSFQDVNGQPQLAIQIQ